MHEPKKQPFTITFDVGASKATRFYFPELRFAIKRAAALSRGAAQRIAISHLDTDGEETQLGVCVLGEYFATPKPPTFEDLQRAIVQRGFAFHLLNRVLDRLQAEGSQLGRERGWSSEVFRALDAAEDIIKDANERVVDEMTHAELTAHYNIERLTEK